MKKTEEFYDKLSSQYTEAIRKIVPRYEEMLSTLFRYLPQDFTPLTVLELGCGTGNLTSGIVHLYPNSKLVAVDISGDILSECNNKLNNVSIQYVQENFSKLSFPEGSFDLIVSSIAIHHLVDNDKERLFQNVHRWLTQGGIFTFSDQFRGETEDIYQKHIDIWKNHAQKNGVSREEWKTWMDHQDSHDYHSPIRRHLKWLEDCGFHKPDCLWRYSLWSIIYAKKK